MKKKIIVSLIAVAALCAAVVYQVLPAGAASPGVLDHVAITPPSATVSTGGTVQFVAQGYDDGNVALTGITFAWSVVPATGAGTINATTGLYTAGTTAGTATVELTATQVAAVTTIKTAAATVTVTATGTPLVTPVPSAQMNVGKLSKILNSYLNSIGFANFLGGQWQVKDGTSIDTIAATPGVVQTVTTTGLTVLANGQTTPTTYTLTSSTAIQPKGAQLAVNDNVVVITVNSQLTMVIKITPPVAKTGENEPPGLKDNEHARPNATNTPPGWSHGNKMGWGKAHGQNGADNEQD